jgi:hypothetical protein
LPEDSAKAWRLDLRGTFCVQLRISMEQARRIDGIVVQTPFATGDQILRYLALLCRPQAGRALQVLGAGPGHCGASLCGFRNTEDLLFERGIDLCHETVRTGRNRFSLMFVGNIRRQRVSRIRGLRQWRAGTSARCRCN